MASDARCGMHKMTMKPKSNTHATENATNSTALAGAMMTHTHRQTDTQ